MNKISQDSVYVDIGDSKPPPPTLPQKKKPLKRPFKN